MIHETGNDILNGKNQINLHIIASNAEKEEFLIKYVDYSSLFTCDATYLI